MPKDMKITNISRTVGKDQVVDELVISFTHDRD
jgi:carboxymethylenebutenolidase